MSHTHFLFHIVFGHDWGESDIPTNFRERDVLVRPVKIYSGKFVSINADSDESAEQTQ